MGIRRLATASFGALILAALAAGAPAAAAVDVDLGATVRLGDDTDVFFAISTRYFDRERPTVERWGRRCESPDDLAVALFIARHSDRSPDALFRLRRQGLGWWEIGLRVGVPPDAWFVPVQRRPGPPYGNAYGHWKKHGKKHKKDRATFVLSDRECRDLVAVRMIHEYYGVPVSVAMDWRASGRSLPTLLSEEYRRRHAGKHTPPGHSKRHPVAHKHGKAKGAHGP